MSNSVMYILCLLAVSLWHGEFQVAGSEYVVIRQKLTWYVAHDACEKMGGSLATIKDEAANIKFTQEVISSRDDCWNYDLSISSYRTAGQRASERSFVWKVANVETPFKYTKWHGNDPNNHEGNENCIQALGIEEGVEWIDHKCNDTVCVVCEK